MDPIISKETDFFKMLNYERENQYLEWFVQKSGMWEEYKRFSSNLKIIDLETGKFTNKWPNYSCKIVKLKVL